MFFPTILLSLAVLPITIVRAACECGFKDELGRVWMDSIVIPFNKVTDLQKSPDLYTDDYRHVQGHGNYSYHIEPSNVFMDGDNLALRVLPPNNGIISSAEIATRREDMLFGTFRSSINFPAASGSCMGFFSYFNDTEEIDIEYVGLYKENLYLSSKRTNPNDYSPDIDAVNLPFKSLPGTMREYRFDWLTDRVDYYVNGAKVGSSVNYLPRHPSRIILENWSSGDMNWSGVPSTEVRALVKNLVMFFNSTNDYIVNKYKSVCAAAANRTDSMCLVSNVPTDVLYGYDANVIRGGDTFDNGGVSAPSGTTSGGSRNVQGSFGVWILSLAAVAMFVSI